ncbi:MAG: 30S ribosomal protein S12 methylthiotransferase RimO [Pirellulales bacterium]
MEPLPIVDPPPQPLAQSPVAPPMSKGQYSFVSLGCPKNLVDSERMLGLLQLDGYKLVHDPAGSDFVVVNTCGFIERARNESFSVIHEMLELKRQGQIKGVIVSGCLAERDKESLLEACPEIDHLVGVFGREHVTKVADRLLGNLVEQRTVFQPAPLTALSDRQRLRITPRHFSFLKISEGCDRLCTFCAIPKMRGKHVSKSMEEILAEARELAADGVRELNIVAQDTTYYGLDLYGQTRLPELLRQLEAVKGIDWIRLLYLYPMYFSDELIATIAASQKIVPYLDMPLQHINNTMLKRMQRKVNKEQTVELLGKLRAAIPGLVMRTTFITGFPGETEEQFQELVEFVREQKFERMGVFTYSFEPDTPAARLPDHLPEEVKEERRARLMEVQQELAFDWYARQVGRQVDVLLDSAVPGEKHAFVGRSYADAPDIDGVVYVTGKKLKAGQIVPCEIVAQQEYDLVAAAVGKPR